MKKIVIISMGWLGSKLYDKFEELNFPVTGTFFHAPKNKKNELRFDYSNSQDFIKLIEFDTIVFNLTPSVIQSKNHFEDFINYFSDKNFIFISSTSVYGNQGQVDENTIPLPESKSGRLLLECENIIKNKIKNYKIIRPAGLYGGERHPGLSLSKSQNQIRGAELVNLVSRDDLIAIIHKIFISGENIVLNAANVNHPSKQEYYSSFAEKNNLKTPNFVDSNSQSSKVVDTIYQQYKINSDLP